jgi:hypothetical protein
VTQGLGKVAPIYFVFDGQSLNLEPDAATCYPTVLMAGHPTIPYANRAIGASSWTRQAVTAPHRTFQLAKTAPITVLLMCGGTADLSIFGGENDSGAQVYADMSAYADAARAAGFAYVIGSTVQDFDGSGANETNRLAANTAILNDANSKFDYVMDFAGDPRLDDSTDTTYYHVDAVHPNAAGAIAMADVAEVQAVDPLLTALGYTG